LTNIYQQCPFTHVHYIIALSNTEPVEGPPVPPGRGDWGGASWGIRGLMLRMKKILVF